MPLADYHRFSIPLAVKDAEMGISFSELENELGGGYYAQVLFGSENGERTWKLTFPTLTGTADRLATGINGETLTWEEYVWDMFCEQKVSGVPFSYQDIRTGQYYLVRFAQKELSYNRLLTKLYSTGLELKQWRIPGEFAFAALGVSQVWSAWDADTYPGSFGNIWTPDTQSVFINDGEVLENQSGDVSQATSGGLNIIRFGGADGIINSTLNVTIKEVYMLLKITEATFGSTDGIITGSGDPNNAFLVGKSGTDEFFDLGLLGTHTHELDGIAYTQATAKAPMNEWGIVHVRNTIGVDITNLQIGADRSFPARHAKMDVKYLIIADELIPKNKQREIMEFLSILKAQLA